MVPQRQHSPDRLLCVSEEIALPNIRNAIQDRWPQLREEIPTSHEFPSAVLEISFMWATPCFHVWPNFLEYFGKMNTFVPAFPSIWDYENVLTQTGLAFWALKASPPWQVGPPSLTQSTPQFYSPHSFFLQPNTMSLPKKEANTTKKYLGDHQYKDQDVRGKSLWSSVLTHPTGRAQPGSVRKGCGLETERGGQQNWCQRDLCGGRNVRQGSRTVPGCLQTQWTPRDSAGMSSAGPDPALNSPLWFHFSSFLSSFSPLGLVLAPCYKEKFRIKTLGQFLKLRVLKWRKLWYHILEFLSWGRL